MSFLTKINCKVEFDENIADDSVVCWGVSVPILKVSLFGKDREERRRRISQKILSILPEILGYLEKNGLENKHKIRFSLASAWVRYYVFRMEVFTSQGTFSYALNILSPNSTLSSFRPVVDSVREILRRFPENIAKPLGVGDEFMLQEWVDGKPLSEFRDGDIMRDVEEARKCISPVSEFLYRIAKLGYVYYPWDDYELVFRSGKPVFLDITRFEMRKLEPEDFLEFYFGVPFTPPEVIKPSNNPAHRLYWRGVRDEDYFGVRREEYIELFLKGVSVACDSYDELKRVLCGAKKVGLL